MSKNILTISHLSKIYPNGVKALKDVSFEVKQGEFLVVIGLSGSGKSTLLRCLNRLVDPTAGQIVFQNKDIASIKNFSEIKMLRKEMGMIFQHFNLINRHSALLNVLMGNLSNVPTWKSILGLFSTGEKTAALNYLNLVGIQDKANLRVDQLSGGQKQRVAIARALNQQPKIILADEPVASLDPATCHIVMNYLKKVNEELGITVICNLHFLSLVRQYASRVIALKDGELVYQGSPQDITDEWFKKIYGENAKEVY